MMDIVYACSERNICYLIENCSSAAIQENNYLSHNEDNFYNETYKQINWPTCVNSFMIIYLLQMSMLTKGKIH